MGSTVRKINRNKAKKSKKTLKKQLGMFDRIPNECLVCQAPFDKSSKEHVQNWKVVIREQKKVVRLYCVECWNTAQKVLQNVMEKEE